MQNSHLESTLKNKQMEIDAFNHTINDKDQNE